MLLKIQTINHFNSVLFSSPDLKNLEVRQEYRHLRAISNGKTGNCSEPDTGSGSDGSGWGSADELEVNVLKTFQRPLRPAASASRKSNVGTKVDRQNHQKSDKKRTTLRQKRDRNKSNISDIQIRVVGTATPQDNSCGDNKNFSDNSYLTNNSSSYSKKHESEDNPLSQPLQHLSGFQSSMAMEAARAAMAFKNGQNDFTMD